MIEYAAIHYGLTNEMVESYTEYPSKEEMVNDLISRNIGMDFDKGKLYDWEKLAKKKKGMDLEKYWLAMKLQNNLGDISKIDQLPEADMWFYSFCCQDISIAGKQKGLLTECHDCGNKFNPMELPLEERDKCPICGSTNVKGSRSGLLKEVERLIVKAIETNTAPKYLCLENVKNLVGKQFKPDFDAWVERLSELNYNTYYQVLNAKNCGVPQNRERVFAFSIRKDVDTSKFKFPLPFDTGIRLKDILEKKVDEKYYINTERADNLINQLIAKGQLKGQRECCDSTINDPNVKDISNAIIARYDAGIQNKKSIGLAVCEPDNDVTNQPILVKNYGDLYVKNLDNSVTLKARDWKGWDTYGSVAIVEETNNQSRLGGMFDGDTKHQAGSVWDKEGVSPTLDTMAGGLRQPCVVDESLPKERFFRQAIETFNENNCSEGDTIDAFNKRVNKSGYCPTLTTRPEGFKTAILPVVKEEKSKSIWKDINSHYKISNKGIVVDVVNKCQVEEIDGKVELEVKDKVAKFPIEALMNKYFSEQTHENSVIVQKVGDRGTNNYSVHDYSNCIPANPMSDRGQLLVEEDTTKPICVGNTTPSGKSQCNAVYSTDGVSQTLCAGTHGYATGSIIDNSETNQNNTNQKYRIRKLTPRECFVLMGFTFEDTDKCKAIGASNSALYKAAGNSIVTNCISLLFEHLYKAQYDSSYICTDQKIIAPTVKENHGTVTGIIEENFHNPQTE